MHPLLVTNTHDSGDIGHVHYLGKKKKLAIVLAVVNILLLRTIAQKNSYRVDLVGDSVCLYKNIL